MRCSDHGRTRLGPLKWPFGGRPSASNAVRVLPSGGQYGSALGLGALVTAVGWIAQPWVGYWSVALIYLLAVMLAGMRLHRGPTMLLATLSAVVWNYFFIPPTLTFSIARTQDMMMFIMFFVVALIVGQLMTQLRERERLEHRGEQRATALYQLARELAAVDSTEAAVQVVMTRTESVFGYEAAAILRDEEGSFEVAEHPASTWVLPQSEEEVAGWVFQHKKPAGTNEEVFPGAAALHLPLLVADRIEGVLAVALGPKRFLAPDQRELLDAFAAQFAVVAEKERLAVAQRRAQVLAESEKLQKTLFDSVSHELKTPIAAIAAALDQPQLNRAEIQRANNRLRRAVEHLLDATRLESGLLKPSLEWCDPAELAHESIARAGLFSEQVHVVCAEDLPLIRVDAGLIEQALATLLHNGSTHGAAHEPSVLTTRRDGDFVRFEVTDRGPGLAHGSEDKVFEKFHRETGSRTGGLGLGLSIARRLAEVHDGTLTAENRPAGGARFVLRLPTGGELHLPE